MRVVISTIAAIIATLSYTVSNVAQIYWLNSPAISLCTLVRALRPTTTPQTLTPTLHPLHQTDGQFIFFLFFLALLSWAQLCALAAWRRDARVLYPHHDAMQRRVFCCGTLCAPRRAPAPLSEALPGKPPLLGLNGDGIARAPPTLLFSLAFFSRFSDAELYFLLGLNNGFAALLQWYATPPSRTPPLLNSIIPTLAIFFCIPLSKWMMGDTRTFFAPLPALSLAAIVAGLIAALLPSALAGGGSSGGGGGGEAPGDVFAWALINVVSQLPSAGALIGIQALLLRNPAAERLTIARFLAYNQVGVAVLLVLSFWVDFLPWFGTPGSAPGKLGAAVAGAFRCSLLGPVGGDAGCPPMTPLWALLGLVPYLAYLAAMGVVSQDSAVYGNVISCVQAVVQSAYFLIPGTNPDAQATPVWSTLLGVALSVGGVALYKRWEIAEEKRAAARGGEGAARAGGEEGAEEALLGGERK